MIITETSQMLADTQAPECDACIFFFSADFQTVAIPLRFRCSAGAKST